MEKSFSLSYLGADC